ncbi:MAG: hypothetical protein GF311_24170 [Candidatus Lokiarchaeota archaeon]|nr:hypothetical protein [Candidatus Lokiarchaeota archaeon]
MKKLKRIVIKVPLDSISKQFFDLFENYELIKIHRQDNNQIFATQKVKFKDNDIHPKIFENKKYGLSYIEIINENREKNEYIFFSKLNWPKKTKEFLSRLDLIIDPPIILDQDRLLVNVITDNKNIDEMIDSLDLFYDKKLEILSISHIDLNEENLFLKLTDRQKEIIYYAVQHGYFEIPRGISTKKIANHFKITRSALYDHLRKIERTIYHSIFK